MALAGTKYYLQGFCIDNTNTSVTIVQSLYENSITIGPKIVISFKAGATTNDFLGILPPGISVISNRKLSQFRLRKLEPTILELNQHLVECYDLENRALNFLVSHDRESLISETDNHTLIVINSSIVNNELYMRQIIDNSLYFKFLSIPLGENYSYPMVNTHSSNLKIKSENPNPIYFSKYTKYRMEYSKVLMGFYDQLKSILPDFEIYLGESRMKNTDNIDSNRIGIYLEGIGDLERRPYMLDPDIQQSVATLNLKIQTADQLKYTHIKNSYQNLTLFSNLARFVVKDTKDLDWMAHVEWQPMKDNTRMGEIRDDNGRFSHVLDLRCEIYFYVVTDEMYRTIQIIDINYVITHDRTYGNVSIPTQINSGIINSHTTTGGFCRPTTIVNNNVTQVDEWDTINW